MRDTMALDRITLSTFRNHAGTQLDGARQLNLLVGENGAGKTNILAVSYTHLTLPTNREV